MYQFCSSRLMTVGGSACYTTPFTPGETLGILSLRFIAGPRPYAGTFFIVLPFHGFSSEALLLCWAPRTSTGDNTFETNFSPAASSKPESKNTYNCMKSGTLDCVPAYQSYACMQEIHACVLTAHKHANYMLFSNSVLLSAAVVHLAPLGGSLVPGPSQWQRRGVL